MSKDLTNVDLPRNTVGATGESDRVEAEAARAGQSSNGAMADLDTLVGGMNSRGLAINDAGFVVGFSDRSTGGFWATL